MRSVSVGELHQKTEECLRLVRNGERVEVTDEGLTVAVLAPPSEAAPEAEEAPFERMVRLGQVRLPTRNLADVVPVAQPPGAPTAFELLMEAREYER